MLLSLSLFFYFRYGDKCDPRESHRSIRETKNVLERFERMRLENEKREKKKNNDGNKNEINRGWG